MDKLLSLGIDPWQMVLYLGNTGLVVIILTYYLYKPILGFIDKRRDQILRSIDESKHLQEEFEKKLDQSEKKRRDTETELKNELNNLQKFTEEKRKQLVGEMEAARTEMMRKAQMEIEQKKDALIKDAEKEIKILMTRIILEIVENKVPETVINDSIHSAWKQYK